MTKAKRPRRVNGSIANIVAANIVRLTERLDRLECAYLKRIEDLQKEMHQKAADLKGDINVLHNSMRVGVMGSPFHELNERLVRTESESARFYERLRRLEASKQPHEEPVPKPAPIKCVMDCGQDTSWGKESNNEGLFCNLCAGRFLNHLLNNQHTGHWIKGVMHTLKVAREQGLVSDPLIKKLIEKIMHEDNSFTLDLATKKKVDITKEQFKAAVGRNPHGGELERCNCVLAGKPGHLSCGWCEEHNEPMFICCCYVDKRTTHRV